MTPLATSCALACMTIGAATPGRAQDATPPDTGGLPSLYTGLDCSAVGADVVLSMVAATAVSLSDSPAPVTSMERVPYVHPPFPPGSVDDGIAPVANDDRGIFDGTGRYLQLLANDVSDVPYDLSRFHLILPSRVAETTDGGVEVEIPGEGRWKLDRAVGDVTFIPIEGFTGAPTDMGYETFDENGRQSNRGNITLEDRHPPILNADSAAFAGAAVEVNVLANDVASDGIVADSLRLVGSDGSRASAVTTMDGEWTVTAAGSVRFEPRDGFTGKPVDLSYVAADSLGNVAAPQLVSLADGIAPVLGPVSGSFTGGAVSVSAFGVNTSGEDLSGSQAQLLGDDAAGGPLASREVPGEGTWTVAADQLTFTPIEGFTDAPSPQRVRALDAGGNASNTVEVTLVDAAAPAVIDDAFVSDEGGVVTVDVLANDGLGPERFAGTLAFICAPDGATISADGQTMDVIDAGQWTIFEGGLRFTPNADFAGDVDLVARYGLADGLGNAAGAQLDFRYADGAIVLPPRPGPEPVPPIGPGEPSAPIEPRSAAAVLVPVFELVLE